MKRAAAVLVAAVVASGLLSVGAARAVALTPAQAHAAHVAHLAHLAHTGQASFPRRVGPHSPVPVPSPISRTIIRIRPVCHPLTGRCAP